MKGLYWGVVLLLAIAAYWIWSSFVPSLTQQAVPEYSHVASTEVVADSASGTPIPSVRCANLAYAERMVAEAQGETVRFLCLLENASVADVLLAQYPCVREVERTPSLLTCDVPISLAQTWLAEGIAIAGLLSFDAEMPLVFYGAVATGEQFVATAPLQQISSLDGRGEVVAVIDTGISTGVAATFHPELLPALYGMTVEPSISGSATSTPIDTATNSHGTHVAGCVVAQGISNTSIRGSAPGVALYFQRIASNGNLYVSNDISQHFERSQAVGASIINCSWGHSTSPTANTYNTHSYNLDAFVWENPEILICVAVGNDGCDKNGDNIVDLSTAYSSETYAKNALTVGAQENARPTVANTNADFDGRIFAGALLAADRIAHPADGTHPGMLSISSRGPLSDGRIAPMVVAPGSAVFSTLKSGSVGGLSGTSMAAPIVSGAAAVLRQYLREVQQIERPTAALLRAGLVLASETLYPGQFGTGEYLEIPETSPNNVEGWGALHLGQMLQGGKTNDEVLGFRDRISLTTTGAVTEFKIPSVVSFSTLSVVLSWIDKPASINASRPLVNDYDLELISPEGVVYQLDDHANPIERIQVDVGMDSGEWTVRIHAYQIGAKGAGNVAAIAWRALTWDDPKPLPEVDQPADCVSVTVTLPEGVAPYVDYPVWPSPGTHLLPKNRPTSVFAGAKLPNAYTKMPQTLSGWVMRKPDGKRSQGVQTSFQWLPETEDGLYWYEVLPGAAFRLR